MNDKLRKAINVKAMLRRKFNRFPSDQLWQKFKRQRNLVNSLKRSSLHNYFDERCNKPSNNNGKTFWNTMKPFLSSKDTNQPYTNIMKDGNIISNQREVCNEFNDFFINIACDPQDCVTPDNVSNMEGLRATISKYEQHPSIACIRELDKDENEFCFHKVDSQQVLCKLKSLKGNASCGFDCVPAKLIKIGAEILSITFTPIINECISKSIFPQDLKRAEVAPIFKKNDAMKPENYRPVSILPALSKTFECIICDQISDYFNEILSPLMCAYRKHHSCVNVLLKCTEDWKRSLDNDQTVGCILIDLSKAFDAIRHDLLIAKLASYGFNTNACLFIQSYLSNREQRVKLGSFRSKWLNVKRGVPQGSIIGPVLFNVFINDLLLSLSNDCTVYNYADDNTLSFSHEDPQVVKLTLEHAAMKAISWFEINGLKANPSKFQAIVLKGKRYGQTIDEFRVSDEIVITPVDNVKLLGLWLDKDLNYSTHIKELTTKCAKITNAVGRISKFLTMETKMKIYKAFVQSNLDYCSIVYHNCNLSDARKVEKIQKRCLRYILNDFSSTYSELLSMSGQSTQYACRLRAISVAIFKICNNLLLPLESTLFTVRQSLHALRGTNILSKPKCNKGHGKNSLAFQGPSIWNNLPDQLRCATNVKEIKSMLKIWNPSRACNVCMACLLRLV